ncbi:hypothetical protein PV10_07692 [Exophiala mesophila]|uniref:Non-structural maintenance of chromosomes element 1 homolog n=1 Tax=Exophiala mesophila TaxID=212818 RepID=A0A0D1ZUA9_EXOME|nr:uncharacterized protein PV10_07692 [Exophiala mesophila]KIV90383.1 hypothetical protein PV10_07692 [Exophiala mesophila]
MSQYPPADDYSDANRAFLQAMLSCSFLTLESARPLLAALQSYNEGKEVLPEDISAEDLNRYVSQANDKVSPLDLEIRTTFHQRTREKVYALVNTTSDAMTQLATSYTPDEIAFVKRMLDEMFDGRHNTTRTEAMCLSGIDAIKLGRAPNNRRETQNADADNANTQSSLGSLSPKEAETLLDKLVQEDWLEKSRAGFYSLSPRALLELKGWLIDTYNEDEDGEKRDKIKTCYACKDIVTVCPLAIGPTLRKP